MTFNHKIFFDRFKQEFDSSLDQKQVDGIEFLLSSFESEPKWKDLRHIAYALTTVYHETAGSFQPVEEGYYLGSRAKAFQKKLRYFPYFGRGYVQLTWKKNYQKASSALGIDFIKNPDELLDPENSFQILTRGLFEGWFGSKLTTHINAQKTDYYNARRCVNILDKAALIARYAKDFENILRASAAVPPSQIQAGQSDQTEQVTGTSDTQIGVLPQTDSSSEQPPTETQDKVAVESEKPLGFGQEIKADIAGTGVLNLGVQGATDYLQQATALGLSPGFWKTVGFIVAIASVIYLVMKYLRWKKKKEVDAQRTETLVAANTTPTNKVTIAATADLDKLKAAGYTIVRRGEEA